MAATVSGKDTSRRNSLKHGLSGQGTVLPPDMVAELPERLASWAEKYSHLADPEVPLLVREIAVATLRIEHCQATGLALARIQPARDAILADSDAELQALKLLDRLPRNPALRIAELKQSSAGVALLIEEWTTLARVLDPEGPVTIVWTDRHLSRLLDLSGLSGDARTLNPRAAELTRASARLSSDPADATARDALRAAVSTQMAPLSALADRLLEHVDRPRRDLIAAGHVLEPGRELRLNRRYESANRRVLARALARLEALDAAHRAAEPPAQPDEAELPPSSPHATTPPSSSFGDLDRLRAALAEHVARFPIVDEDAPMTAEEVADMDRILFGAPLE